MKVNIIIPDGKNCNGHTLNPYKKFRCKFLKYEDTAGYYICGFLDEFIKDDYEEDENGNETIVEKHKNCPNKIGEKS